MPRQFFFFGSHLFFLYHQLTNRFTAYIQPLAIIILSRESSTGDGEPSEMLAMLATHFSFIAHSVAALIRGGENKSLSAEEDKWIRNYGWMTNGY